MWVALAASLILPVLTPSSSASTAPPTQARLPDDCNAAFKQLFERSTALANEKRYLQAAARREASADVFQDCLAQERAPHHGQYPLDGVGAYLAAAVFWHLAGETPEARKSLTNAKSALHSVLQTYPEASLPDLARGEPDHMRKMIRDDDAGCWGVWQESDNDSGPPTGVAQIVPQDLACGLRNP